MRAQNVERKRSLSFFDEPIVGCARMLCDQSHGFQEEQRFAFLISQNAFLCVTILN